MIKKILKIFFISLSSIAVLCGGVVGVLAITGVFNKEEIPFSSLQFENSVYYIDSDTSTYVTPTPIDTTETNYELTVSDQQVVTVPTEITAGNAFIISPTKTNGVNNGGVAVITAFNGLYNISATVYVDVPVQSISLSTTQDLANNTLIVGNTANVKINYNSANSIAPFGAGYDYINNQKSKVYAEFNKDTQQFEESTYNVIQGADIASIHKATGEITTVGAGEFTVEAKVYKTYQAKVDYEMHKIAGHFEQNQWNIGLVDGKTEEEYLADILVTTTRSFTVRDVELTSIAVEQPQNSSYIQNIYLYESIDLTYEELGLTLTPEESSGLNSDDMEYRFKDVVLTAVKGSDYQDNSDVLQVTDLVNNNQEKIGWTIKALNYQDRILSKTALKFEITNSVAQNSESIYTTLPINIVTNDIQNSSDAFVLTSGSLNEEDKYNKNLNFYVYQNNEDGTENIVRDEFDLKTNTNIIFTDSTKPVYMTVRYFIKDYDATHYDSRIIECVKETGEIVDGKIVILRTGTVNVIAKALKI